MCFERHDYDVLLNGFPDANDSNTVQLTVDIGIAEIADFSAIYQLDQRVWSNNSHSSNIPDGEHLFRILVEHGLVLKASLDNRVIGALIAFRSIKEKSLCLHKVFVEQAYRSQGIGTALLQCYIRELDQLRIDSFLTVDPENKHARQLYHRFGFSEESFIEGYYSEQEDRIVLTRYYEQ